MRVKSNYVFFRFQNILWNTDALVPANRLYTNIPINVREATKTKILLQGAGPDEQSPLLIRKG